MKSTLLGVLNRPNGEASEEEIYLILIQLVVTLLFLITTAISAILSYDLYLKKTNQSPLFEDQEADKIDAYNRLFVLILVILLTFVSYRYLKIKTEKEEEIQNSTIQFGVAIITLIASILSTYVSLNNLNKNFNFTDIENPNI